MHRNSVRRAGTQQKGTNSCGSVWVNVAHSVTAWPAAVVDNHDGEKMSLSLCIAVMHTVGAL
jgi:hypothetical protein